MLGVVAAALILAAVMNYIMIVISSLIGRAKGIAVRRCYGAGNRAIMGIVFKETLINLAVSLVLAFLLVLAFRNTIEEIMMTSLGALFSPQSIGFWSLQSWWYSLSPPTFPDVYSKAYPSLSPSATM